MDVPIHFMQEAHDDDHDEDRSSKNTDAEGATPDVQGYR